MGVPQKNRIYLQILLSLLLLSSCGEKKQIVIEDFAPRVKVIKISEETVTPGLESFGSLSFFRKTDISAAVDGTINKIYATEGENVSAGTVLGKIENIQLEIRKKQALSAITQAEAAYELAMTKYKEGLLAVEIKLLSIEKLQIEIDQRKLELAEQQETLANKEELFEAGGISIEAIKNQRLSFLSAESAYQAQLKDMEIRKVGLRDKDIRERGYDVPENREARNNLLKQINTETLAAEVSVARAQLVSAQSQLDSVDALLAELLLTSPISGILGTKYLEEGERISTDTKLFTVLDTSRVYAVFNVQEDEMLMLSEGMAVEITVDALGGKTMQGSIKLISPIIDPQTGNVVIKALFTNADRNLKPGMFARVKVIYGKPRPQIIIPVTAITKKTGNKGKAFTVVNGTLFVKDLILGKEEEGRIEVRKGLTPGELVVDSPSPILREGETVEAEQTQ